MDKLTLTIDEASSLASICRVKLYEEINSGRLKARKLGTRKTLILKTDLEEFLQNLQPYPIKEVV